MKLKWVWFPRDVLLDKYRQRLTAEDFELSRVGSDIVAGCYANGKTYLIIPCDGTVMEAEESIVGRDNPGVAGGAPRAAKPKR